ncbi:DNA/RNA helicase domain-containing protein [Vibrio hyugaensis]|uniref:DNA/RNA helicase domain-containing protein n=1 Tax=Vibrio hyugaensis TaxID=1534743 RepID=UPI0005EFBA28|nr:DNA/RNA helicase domain-containing protein [Vibrio hyugaensis]
MTHCYADKIGAFLQVQEEQWLTQMSSEFESNFPGLELGDLQKRAWADCFKHLQVELSKCTLSDGYIIFEYVLPMEGGRRPDVLLLIENKLFILEFKMKDGYQRADYDQLCGYYRELCNYHHESAKLDVIAGLVLTQSTSKLAEIESDISILSSDKLRAFLDKHLTGAPTCTDLKSWLESAYVPLPNLVDAAVEIFNDNPIDELKSAKSAGIYDALNELDKVTEWVEGAGNRNKANVLTLVTGVPGAGKTLLGLEFVHRNKTGQFLSGNGPLVDVLQHALKNKTFVRALKDFKRQYMKQGSKPHTNLIVFDEAQRMWDEQKNKNYQMSEPSCIIHIADKDPKPCHYVALIGEGQEIHTGEEVGISLWCDALKESCKPWLIFCPPTLKHHFNFLSSERVRMNPLLNLDQSLRSHSANLYPNWVDGVLRGQSDDDLAKQAIKNGFNIYVTRDLEKAKRYCRTRYQGTAKKYGLLSSSSNTKYTEESVGPWFHDDVSAPKSCCRFERTIDEFKCQGLELDMPILVWADDFLFDGKGWQLHKSKRNVRDPYQIKLNSYRVLMTRGRDGVILFFPQESLFDETYAFFESAGGQEL